METLEELKAIRDNAPEDATHFDEDGDYIKISGNYLYCYNGITWFEIDFCGSLRSLSDINRIIELMEAVEALPDKINTERYLEGLDRPTEFAISQAKSFAIGSVFDSIRKAKKLLCKTTN